MSTSNMDFTPLQQALRGPVTLPSHADYDQQRSVYNAMIDRRPACIAHCVDAADVMTTVNFARNNGIRLSIRGGGHNAGGLGVCDNGLVCDMSGIKYVHVDPKAKTARVGGGCTWGDVDHATHAFGLATPSGIISTTGVGGLALGGGIGHLSRACGLTVDNILEAEVVLADGSFVKANKDQNSDLYWAIRGGGGNFGVVTSFLLQLHDVKMIMGGPTFWELDRSAEILKWYRNFILKAPRDLNGFFAFLEVPDHEMFPEFARGQKVAGVVWCYTGDKSKFDEVFAPVRATSPMLDGVGEVPFPGLNGVFDQFYPKGHYWYWRADFIKEIPDEAVAEHVRFGKALPTAQSTMHLYPIDGRCHDVDKDETAFYYRDANWAQVVVGVDPDPANKDKITNWTKGYFDATHPHSMGGAYINFMMDEGQDRIKATYRDNYDRLTKVKAKYDPNNFFNVNQNIKPTA